MCSDSVAGEGLLVDRLAAAGHRRFGVMTGPADSFVSQMIEGRAARLAA